jgi:hypothetical protein
MPRRSEPEGKKISRGLPAMMFRDCTPAARHRHTAVFERFADAVCQAMAPFAVVYTQSPPLPNTD